MEMILFIGIQASGKSEFYKRQFYKTHIRLNMDMLHTRNRERILMEACLAAKQPFVVDNTNPTAGDRARYISTARAHGFTITGYYFSAELKKALERNEQRQGKEKIPLPAVLGTYKKLELPTYAEGFDQLYYVSITPEGDFFVADYEEDET